MANEMVMRSVYLRPEEDAALRQLAFEIEVSKSDLIRSAISAKLEQWLQSNSMELVLKDVELGKRQSRSERAMAARAEVKQAKAEQAPTSSTRAAQATTSTAKAESPKVARGKSGRLDAQQGARGDGGRKGSTQRSRAAGRQPERPGSDRASAQSVEHQREPALAD